MKRMCDYLKGTFRIEHADNSGDLIKPLLNEIEPGDIVLIKGSSSFRMHKLVDCFLENKNSFDASPAHNTESSNVI